MGARAPAGEAARRRIRASETAPAAASRRIAKELDLTKDDLGQAMQEGGRRTDRGPATGDGRAGRR